MSFNRQPCLTLCTGAAATLSPRFTTPRGDGYSRGLGLSKRQVDDLTNFLENALYDPALLKYDPKSTTDTLQPNVRDLTYSKYRPDLPALGAVDGLMPSGRAIDDNDPLARRDQGLEFLDMTSQLHFGLMDSDRDDGRQQDRYRITNNSTSTVDTHLLLIAKGLPNGIRMVNAGGATGTSEPLPARIPARGRADARTEHRSHALVPAARKARAEDLAVFAQRAIGPGHALTEGQACVSSAGLSDEQSEAGGGIDSGVSSDFAD